LTNLEREALPSRTPAEPTEAEVRAVLGEAGGLLTAFLERNRDLRPEWKYYGPKNGWSLKLFHKKRNMCFIGPHPGGLAMSFIFGKKAFTRLLASDLRRELRQHVRHAKKYPEGYGVHLILTSESDLVDAQVLLEVKSAN
jgi:hypothetical protein